jgi:hypothetical protein
MTRYCVALDRHELIATWGTGEGDLATGVTGLPTSAETNRLLELARALTDLSSSAWRTYTHPASAVGSLEPNSEGWRREEERKDFDKVAAAIGNPNLPSGGTMIVSYGRLMESAHRVGRALHDLGDPQVAKAVAADAAAELAAVAAAELGDLTGRAQQAVLLSREDASPVQVAAADLLLRQDPFGSNELFVAIDPTAAAVAAAHWLAAAADVAAEASGQDPTQVVLEADNIEELPHRTPTVVLELISDGASARAAVTTLVRHALHVADGLLADPLALRDQLDGLEEEVAQYTGQDEPDLTDVAVSLTPLDPKRPARDLLEDLLSGIHGCWLLYSECDDFEDDAQSGTDDGEEWSDAQAEAHDRRCRERFADLVRDKANDHPDRLV